MTIHQSTPSTQSPGDDPPGSTEPAIFALDRGGAIRDANQAAADLTGHSRETLRGLSMQPLWQAQELPWSAKGARPSAGTAQLHHQAGHSIPVAWSLSPLQLGAEEVLILTVTPQLVSSGPGSRSRSAAAELQLAIDTAKLGIWRLNLETNHLDWNDQQLAIYGISREEFQTNLDGWRGQVHPDDEGYANSRLAEAFAGQRVYDVAFRVIRPDGNVRHLNASAAPIFNDQGKIIELIGINIDVTDLIQQQEQQREQATLFQTIFDNSLNAIMVTNHAGDYLMVNPAAAKMFGYPIQALQGMNVADLQTPTRPDAATQYERYLTQGREVGEFTFLRPDGEIRISQYHAIQISPALHVSILSDITEQKQTEQALKESEQRFRGLMHQAPWPLAIYAPDGTLVDYNSEFRQLWHVPAGYPVIKRYNPLRAQRVRELGMMDYVQRAFAGEAVLLPPFEADPQKSLAELGITIENTEKIWIRSHYYPIKDAQGNLLNVVTMQDNITEQIRTEAALKETQENFEKAFFHSPIPMLIINMRTSERLAVNDQLLELIGYSREEYLQHRLDALNLFVHPDERDRALARVMAEGHLYNQTYPIRTRQGEIKEVLASGVMMEPRDQGVALISWIDITERKRTEQYLRQLTQAIEQSPVSVEITDAQGIIEYVNPKFCQVTGYSQDEALGQSPNILKSGKHPPEFYENMWRTISRGETWQGEIQNRKKSGKLFWEQVSIAGVKDPEGRITHYVAVKEDITERRRIETEHARQDRLAAVGQMAAGIAHDFNNILGVIVIYAGMLTQSPELSERLRERARTIQQQAHHASNLVQQILDFSRRSALEKQPVNLLPLLKEQAKLLQRTLPAHIETSMNYGDDEYMLEADPTRMQQVITNLAVNARDAMPNGGRLHLELFRVALKADSALPIPGMKPGNWIHLSVRDTGIGISPEALDHIFEPFFTTKERGRGTGLGLAQVYGIVKQHGGYITVSSQVGIGTTFDLYLPPLLQAGEMCPALDNVQNLPQGNGQSILIVEDDPVLRTSLTELLSEWNYHVLQAGDGLEAREILARERVSIGLVLSDVMMPHMDGAELLAYMQRHTPTIPIILMTGYSGGEEMQRVEALGPIQWVPKPLDMQRLAQLIHQTFHQQ